MPINSGSIRINTDQLDLYIFLLIFIDLLLISIDPYWSVLIGHLICIDQMIHIDPISAIDPIDPIDLPSPVTKVVNNLPDFAF